MKNFLWAILLFPHHWLSSDECPALLNTPEEKKKLAELRVKFLKSWDRALTWTLSPKNRPYPFKELSLQKSFSVESENLLHFNENYGYFSVHRPLVGSVTKEKKDIQVTNCLLKSIYEDIHDKEQCRFSTDEVLAKVMAYRNLEEGMKISVPTMNEQGEIFLETYLVDYIIDLWRGMPAFGLIPEKDSFPPILLFRGTDLSFNTEKGWASIFSDLDIAGPGLKTFVKAKSDIQVWLKKMARRGMPARTLGFSLGGAFVIYTMLYFPDLLNLDPHFPSIAFNPPGIKKEFLIQWDQFTGDKPAYIIYINKGDFVSTIGFLLPNVWELSLQQPMEVIQAHVALISMHPSYWMKEVDVDSENRFRE